MLHSRKREQAVWLVKMKDNDEYVPFSEIRKKGEALEKFPMP